MTQDFSVSWSFNSSFQQPSAGDGGGELIALAPCSRYPLPGNRFLLVRQGSEARGVVTGEVLQALGHCTRLRTLDQHARNLAERFPSLVGSEEDARAVLGSLRSTGLFLASRGLEALARSVKVEALDEARGTVVCIGACDRPALLERVLNSLLEMPRDGRDPIIVIDDSRESANIAKNRQITQQADARYAGQLVHYGLEAQMERVAALKMRLPDHEEAVEFLLGRQPDPSIPSYGRVLNHALLLSLGKTLVYIDDDTLCQGHAPPIARGQGVTTGISRREADFLGGAEPWAEGEAKRIDPVAEFSRYAGRTNAEALALLAAAGEPLALAEADARHADALAGSGEIAAVTCGIYGDPGTEGGQWLYMLSAESRARLLRDEQGYRRVARERRVWLGQVQPHLSLEHAMLSVNKAYDNSRPLPPHFPMLRNEDLLFSRMLSAMRPESFILELPWAVSHLPAESRAFSDEALDRPQMLGFSRLSTLFLDERRAQFRSGDAMVRLAEIGAMFEDLASAPPRRIAALIDERLARVRVEAVQRLNQTLVEDPQLPDYYRRDILRQIEANESVLINTGAPGPFDLFERFPDQGPPEMARELWRRFAAGIRAWPEIVRVSRA